MTYSDEKCFGSELENESENKISGVYNRNANLVSDQDFDTNTLINNLPTNRLHLDLGKLFLPTVSICLPPSGVLF